MFYLKESPYFNSYYIYHSQLPWSSGIPHNLRSCTTGLITTYPQPACTIQSPCLNQHIIYISYSTSTNPPGIGRAVGTEDASLICTAQFISKFDLKGRSDYRDAGCTRGYSWAQRWDATYKATHESGCQAVHQFSPIFTQIMPDDLYCSPHIRDIFLKPGWHRTPTLSTVMTVPLAPILLPSLCSDQKS